MKKIIVTILCIIMIVFLAACTAERPANISIMNSVDTPPESVVIFEDSVWPKNEYTENIPVPPGMVGWTMLDNANESCNIQISDITQAQFDAYYQKLLNSGFKEVEKVEEDVNGQEYISIGSIISDGNKSISLAFADTTLMMTIFNKPVEGSSLGFLEFGNLINVYINAYSTYDVENGVRIITELYVPEDEMRKPAFSMVSGIATITLGSNTSTHYLGTTADGEATVGVAINTKMVGASGEKGTVVVAGTAYADNAIASGGSFSISYEISIP